MAAGQAARATLKYDTMASKTDKAPDPIRRKPGASKPGNDRAPALVMALAVGILALPSAVLAFSSRLDVSVLDSGAHRELGSFAPSEVDPRLARALAARPAGKGPLFRFTPAGLATRPDRSVTVAVRVDSASASSITVRGVPLNAPHSASTTGVLRIAPTAYNLGVSRGYQGFAPTGTGVSGQGFVLAKTKDNHKLEMPDLSAYVPGDDSKASPTTSRLAPHISLDERERAGRAPRTLESVGEQSVNLGGSYRISRNIDVTAGVRYSQDRDRLKPQSDGKSDSQAVFVGTQFRF